MKVFLKAVSVGVFIMAAHLSLASAAESGVTMVIDGKQEYVLVTELAADQGTMLNSGESVVTVNCQYTGGTIDMPSIKVALQAGQFTVVKDGQSLKAFFCKSK